MKTIYNVPIVSYEGFPMSVEKVDKDGKLVLSDACPTCGRGDSDPIPEQMTTRTVLRTIFNAYPRTESRREDDVAITNIMTALLEHQGEPSFEVEDTHYEWLFGGEETQGFFHREVKNPQYDADVPGSKKTVDFGRLLFGFQLTTFKDQIRNAPKGQPSLDGMGKVTELTPV